MSEQYDYIITGGGMAGLSLAYYLSLSPLRDSSILILDKVRKNQNDRTWCFWERGEGPFEPILYHTWDKVAFYGTTFQGQLNIGDYRYKMLRGIDFYQFIHNHLRQFPNVIQRQTAVLGLEDTPSGAVIHTESGTYQARYVFDSTHPLQLNIPRYHNLLQHFKGWVITTEKPCFDPRIPRMMDFRVEQHGDCRFVYVLPFNQQSALIEFTLFSDKLLPGEAYDAELRHYINQYLDTGNYQIQETEFGIIPMTDEPTQSHPSPHIIRIGTSGGYTKPSTGYTFQRSQRYLKALTDYLAATGQPKPPAVGWRSTFKLLLDSILLNVLQYHRHSAADIFTRLYERNAPAQIFKFLDEDTSLAEDLRIMTTVPLLPFTAGALDVLRKRLAQ